MKYLSSIIVLLMVSSVVGEEFKVDFAKFPGVGTGWVHVDNSQVTPSANDQLVATVKYTNVDMLAGLISLNAGGTGVDEVISNAGGTVTLTLSNSALNSATQFHVMSGTSMPDINTDENAMFKMMDTIGALKITRIKGLTHNIRTADKSAAVDWKTTGIFRVGGVRHLCAGCKARSLVGWTTRVKLYNVDSQGAETLVTTINLTDGQADKEMAWLTDVTLPTTGTYGSDVWKLKFKGEAENLSTQHVVDLGSLTRYFSVRYQGANPPN